MERRRLDMVRQCARNERRAQINGDGCEPDHRDAEEDAVRRVEQARSHVGAETSVGRMLK